MTAAAWFAIGELVLINLLIAWVWWLYDRRDSATNRADAAENELARQAQARAEQAAAAEMHRDNLPRLINRLEAYRQGAPARRLEGE